MKIELKHDIKNDKYTEYVCETFDIQNKNQSNLIIEANLENLPKEWNVGVVYGGSGTGKTTILKNYFNKEMDISYFDNSKSLISNFDWLEPKEATFLLTSMGLSSVPTWLRSFDKLSNGEQYRANLAYIVGKAKNNEVILIDEYTSVVDRDVAKAMSNALQKYIRTSNKKIVLASCHFDIMEWLQPDWIYSPQKGRLEIAPRLRRPKIELQIVRCRYETWKLFKQHHYLTDELNKASNNYLILWNKQPIAFIGILPSPSGYYKNGFRVSRLVVLPDFQGLGIGINVLNYISSLYKSNEKTMYIKSSHPGILNKLEKDSKWIKVKDFKNLNSLKKHNDKTGNKQKIKVSVCKSFKYIGEKSKDDTSIILMKTEIYKDIAQNQINIFDIIDGKI